MGLKHLYMEELLGSYKHFWLDARWSIGISPKRRNQSLRMLLLNRPWAPAFAKVAAGPRIFTPWKANSWGSEQGSVEQGSNEGVLACNCMYTYVKLIETKMVHPTLTCFFFIGLGLHPSIASYCHPNPNKCPPRSLRTVSRIWWAFRYESSNAKATNSNGVFSNVIFQWYVQLPYYGILLNVYTFSI